jgi:hypothetical protein
MPSHVTWFICSCDKRLETTDDVNAHDMAWLALGHDKRCQYPGCTTISPQTSNAKRHWRTHLPDRLGKYFCSKCDVSYVKPEALEKHQAAVVCRKNRRRCRITLEYDAAPLPPPTIRQTATPFLDLQADEWFPLHPERNDTDPLSAPSTASHATELNSICPESPPNLSIFALTQDRVPQGFFTMDTSLHMHLFDAHQHPVMLPVDRQEMTLAVEVSGAWKTKALFFHDLLTETNFGLTPQPNLDSWWRVIVGKMIDEKPAMLVSILATHAQSRGDGISSTWSINLMWSGRNLLKQCLRAIKYSLPMRGKKLRPFVTRNGKDVGPCSEGILCLSSHYSHSPQGTTCPRLVGTYLSQKTHRKHRQEKPARRLYLLLRRFYGGLLAVGVIRVIFRPYQPKVRGKRRKLAPRLGR